MLFGQNKQLKLGLLIACLHLGIIGWVMGDANTEKKETYKMLDRIVVNYCKYYLDKFETGVFTKTDGEVLLFFVKMFVNNRKDLGINTKNTSPELVPFSREG